MKLISLITLMTIFIGCKQAKDNDKNSSALANNFIQAPIKNADISFKEYSVDAKKGDTIFYQTGSIILFPPNSFVDKDGNVIQGTVKVKYREFASPIDFYLSGIPMNYDSLGKQYTFESTGMCEILAFKDSQPVFVNPKSKPEINIASQNSLEEQTIYYLDPTQQKWVNKAPNILTNLNKKSNNNKMAAESPFSDITEPLKPEKATNKSPVIKIEIDPASFKELLVYDNLQFQLDPNEKNFNPKDTADDWSNIELLKGNSNDLYTIKFSNATRSVSYAARPVLEGKDYDKALKTFDKKNKEYQKKLADRLKKEKANNEKNIQNSIAITAQLEENKRIERLNALIEIRNKEIIMQNKIIEAQNKEIERRNAIRKKENDEFNFSNKILSSFEIDGFGIWNCDKAYSLDYLKIVANFKDNKGNPIELSNIAVLYKSFNGILGFQNNQIQVVKNAENMIIGVYKGRFAYISFKDYNVSELNLVTREQTFTMTIVDEKNNNYEYIKTIVGRQ